MIKSIYPGSVDITVSGGSSVTPYINPTYSGSGMIKYDPASHSFQVNDGHSWVTIPNNDVTIDLSYESKKALDWARRKYREEQELEELAKTNPAINDLVNQIKEKQDQLKMVKALIKKNDESVEMQAP
jgi:hypothetical protein